MSDPALVDAWMRAWLAPLHPLFTQVLQWLPQPVAALLLRSQPTDWLLVCLFPLFSLAALAELWHMRRTGVYEWKDALASINIGSVYILLTVFVVVGVVLPIYGWIHAHRLFTFAMTPWRFVLLYVAVEFCFYWFHRTSHRVRWFWCAHVVHHGSEHMNFTTASRQSWLYDFAGNWLFYTPLVWLGFAPRWVLLAVSLNLAYQFFLHTQWVDKLPAWVEWVFNTPSHHRAHHGRNPRYIDRNYGGTFIVFDRLFGTFVPENEPVDYGLVRQVHSHNIVWLNLHEWVDMIRDVLRPAPWRVRLKHVWGPPEWQPPQPAGGPDNAGHAPPTPAPSVQQPAARHP
jgi:sterol desaturase/sphingolipid hydroxylase (fatty acid hydroxylase superfamily)